MLGVTHLLLPTLIPLSRVGQPTYFSSCCDKETANTFFTGRLPDVKPSLKWVQTNANAARNNGLTYFSKHGGARDHKFGQPSDACLTFVITRRAH
jgi:hypothetical protein